jgi:hypothetical protein
MFTARKRSPLQIFPLTYGNVRLFCCQHMHCIVHKRAGKPVHKSRTGAVLLTASQTPTPSTPPPAAALSPSFDPRQCLALATGPEWPQSKEELRCRISFFGR